MAGRRADRQAGRQASRRADRQAGGQTGRQAGRQAGWLANEIQAKFKNFKACCRLNSIFDFPLCLDYIGIAFFLQV